jgi:hypothetical protein
MKKTLTALAIALSLGMIASSVSAHELTGPDEASDPTLPVYSSN